MLTSIRFWIGLAITAGFLFLLFIRFDFGEMREALAEANYLYLIPGIAVYFVSLLFRSYRWRYVLTPFAEIKTLRLLPVVVVGYMANNVLPMRIGEFARSYYLSTREPVRGSTALATIIIERVFDGLTLLFFLAAGALFLPVLGLAQDVGSAAQLPTAVLVTLVIVPFVGVLTAMVMIAIFPQTFTDLARGLLRFAPNRLREPVLGLIVRFLAGFTGLHDPRRLALVFVLSIPIWLAEATMYFIVALGFDLQTHFGSFGEMAAVMLLITAVSNLATSIPSSQGSVGPFEFFAREALVFLTAGSVGLGLATAYAIVLHLALLLPVIAAGLLYLTTVGLSLGELTKRHSREAA